MPDFVRLALVKKQIDEYIESLGDLGNMKITAKLGMQDIKVTVSFTPGTFGMTQTKEGEDPFFQLSVAITEGAPLTDTFNVYELAQAIYQAIGNALSNQLQYVLKLNETRQAAEQKPRLILPGQ